MADGSSYTYMMVMRVMRAVDMPPENPYYDALRSEIAKAIDQVCEDMY